MHPNIGHGQSAQARVQTRSDKSAANDTVSTLLRAQLQSANHGRFGYFFAGNGIPFRDTVYDDFAQIAAAMMDNGQHPGPTGLEAILTYFGQFIDHDITINTDKDPANGSDNDFSIEPPDRKLTKNPRNKVVATLRNARKGTARLDSLYGDDTPQDGALREGARMRIGETGNLQPFDLPRFAQMPADVQTLLNSQQPTGAAFFPAQAVIGDGRNDENLIVAQLHLAFLRFHNAVVDTIASGNEEARFAQASEIVRRHYQWMIVEQYLARVGDRDIVEIVMRASAPLYKQFADGEVTSENAPLPLEFSVAAFRFGHSMIRPDYNFNETFRTATLTQLFQFTGKAELGTAQKPLGQGIGFPGRTRLADVWIIEWSNFLSTTASARMARPVDTEIAESLHDLFAEQRQGMKSLPARNLRRSYVLNIPTAQDVLADIAARADLWGGEINLTPLTHAQIASVPGGQEVIDLGYGDATPLWFYILAEAQLQRSGKRLGPLGTLIVAETLIGIIAHDPSSYWNRNGSSGQRWHPRDEPPAGNVIDSFEAMLRFAGVL